MTLKQSNVIVVTLKKNPLNPWESHHTVKPE